MKKVLSLALILLLILSLSVAASAEALPSVETNIIQPDGFDTYGPGEAATGEESAPTEIPASPPPQNSNTPFFIGALISVLIFLGVALYCKAKGNKTY